MKKFLAIVLCAVMVLSLAACGEEAKLYEKYADIITMLEAKDYTAAMGVISAMAVAEQNIGKELPELAEVLGDEWYAISTDNVNAPAQLTMRQDGTCSIDGKELVWLQRFADQYNMGGVIMDGGEYKYWFEFSMDESGVRVPRISLWTCHVEGEEVWGDKHLGNYRNHAQITLAMKYWERLDGSDILDDYFSIDSDTMWYNDITYLWKITSAEGEMPLVMTATADDGSGATLTMNLAERDGHYVLTVVDDATSESALYITEDYGFETSWPEYRYPQVMSRLNRYLEGSSFRVEGYEDYLSGNAALKYLMDEFAALGDWKDSAEYLSRFSMIPSQLTKVVQVTTDQLGNTSESTQERYTYDANGVLISAYSQSLAESYGIYERWDTLNFEYDNTGKVVKINIGSGSSVSGVCTPEYDASGLMVSMNVQRTNGQYVSTFTYDEKGRVVGIDMPVTDSDSDHYVFTFTYDDAGRVTQKTKSWYKDYYSWIYDYVYESKPLAQLTETYTYRGEARYDITKVFTSDDQGRSLSASVTSTNESDTYASRELNYVYEDLYFFDSTGLVTEENN